MVPFGHSPSYKCTQSLVIGAYGKMPSPDLSRACVADIRQQSAEQRASHSQCRHDGLMALRQVAGLERQCNHAHMTGIFLWSPEQWGSGTQAVPDLTSRLRATVYLSSIYCALRGKAADRAPEWGAMVSRTLPPHKSGKLCRSTLY